MISIIDGDKRVISIIEEKTVNEIIHWYLGCYDKSIAP